MTQAPIEPRHKDEAAKAAGYLNFDDVDQLTPPTARVRKSILAHAQTLANLEAARAENEAFKREVSEACANIILHPRGTTLWQLCKDELTRFIIPASDPQIERKPEDGNG